VHHLFDATFAEKFRKIVEGRYKRYGHFEYDTEGEIERYKVRGFERALAALPLLLRQMSPFFNTRPHPLAGIGGQATPFRHRQRRVHT